MFPESLLATELGEGEFLQGNAGRGAATKLNISDGRKKKKKKKNLERKQSLSLHNII